MKVTITLEQSFGHYDNRPTKEYVLKQLTENLPKVIKSNKEISHWQVSAIVVD